MFSNAFKSLQKSNLLIKNQVKNYSSKKHNTNFDYHIDWFFNSLLLNKLSLTKAFLLINTGLFAYCWLKPTEEGRYRAQNGVSFSADNLRAKDTINMLGSLLGSRRIDDFLFDSAVLLTIGSKLEKMYGTPLIFKMSLFSLYLGILSTSFWINSEFSKNERYLLKDPKERDIKANDYKQYKYMSQHSISMCLLYFYLFKFNRMLVLPVIAIDMYYWGLIYGNAALTGLAFGIIL
jgi:hypothetical protein